MSPELARGVLGYTRRPPRQHSHPREDAEPGKIMHEMRTAKWPRSGEIPFGATTAASMPRRCSSCWRRLLRAHRRPGLRRSCGPTSRGAGVDRRYGDRDGDGFVEYRRSAQGVGPPGMEGLATTPCSTPTARWPRRRSRSARCRAMCTRRAARGRCSPPCSGRRRARRTLTRTGGRCATVRAGILVRGPVHLRAGARRRKRPCRVRTSNAGHCLFAGIAVPGTRAARVGTRCSTTHHSRAGGCARWRARRVQPHVLP